MVEYNEHHNSLFNHNDKMSEGAHVFVTLFIICFLCCCCCCCCCCCEVAFLLPKVNTKLTLFDIPRKARFLRHTRNICSDAGGLLPDCTCVSIEAVCQEALHPQSFQFLFLKTVHVEIAGKINNMAHIHINENRSLCSLYTSCTCMLWKVFTATRPPKTVALDNCTWVKFSAALTNRFQSKTKTPIWGRGFDFTVSYQFACEKGYLAIVAVLSKRLVCMKLFGKEEENVLKNEKTTAKVTDFNFSKTPCVRLNAYFFNQPILQQTDTAPW